MDTYVAAQMNDAAVAAAEHKSLTLLSDSQTLMHLIVVIRVSRTALSYEN